MQVRARIAALIFLLIIIFLVKSFMYSLFKPSINLYFPIFFSDIFSTIFFLYGIAGPNVKGLAIDSESSPTIFIVTSCYHCY